MNENGTFYDELSPTTTDLWYSWLNEPTVIRCQWCERSEDTGRTMDGYLQTPRWHVIEDHQFNGTIVCAGCRRIYERGKSVGRSINKIH